MVVTTAMGSRCYHKRQAGLGRAAWPLVPRGCHHLLPSSSSVLLWAWCVCVLGGGSLGGTWLDTELEFGLLVSSKEVTSQHFKVVRAICYLCRMVRTG